MEVSGKIRKRWSVIYQKWRDLRKKAKRMEELQNSKLKRPMDKSVCGGDMAALSALMGIFNHESNPPHEEKHVTNTTTIEPPIEQPLPVKVLPQRLFFTGLPGAGKKYLAGALNATVVHINAPIEAITEEFFGKVSRTDADIFEKTVKAWGCGVIDKHYPLTPERACFLSVIKNESESSVFGMDPYFWLNVAIDSANSCVGRSVILGVETEDEFKQLLAVGFVHYHIFCSLKTRTARVGGTKPIIDKLAEFLDNDVMRKISAKPTGARLHCVWNDDTPAPAPGRLLTVEQFLQGIE